MTRGNEPAFPVADYWELACGLTKREKFAETAMNGLLSNDDVRLRDVAREAVRQADALIAALSESSAPEGSG